jgi:hypothetical protein
MPGYRDVASKATSESSGWGTFAAKQAPAHSVLSRIAVPLPRSACGGPVVCAQQLSEQRPPATYRGDGHRPRSHGPPFGVPRSITVAVSLAWYVERVRVSADGRRSTLTRVMPPAVRAASASAASVVGGHSSAPLRRRHRPISFEQGPPRAPIPNRSAQAAYCYAWAERPNEVNRFPGA